MSTPYNRKIQAIVIHHMGDGKASAIPISQRWNPYNYDYPEYDYGIEADGGIVQGRPLTYQGAHCISDKPPYSQRGAQWWNQNSIGIGLAGDFTKYAMPSTQFNALVGLVKKLMADYGLTLDDVYPHGQVTYTDCPGCTYSKVPALKGKWDYNEFEKAILGEEKTEEETNMDCAIVLYSWKDMQAGLMAQEALVYKGIQAGIFCRDAKPEFCKDAINAKQLIVVGGPDTQAHNNKVFLSGDHARDTLGNVVEWTKKFY